jgi:hypothetical protein
MCHWPSRRLALTLVFAVTLAMMALPGHVAIAQDQASPEATPGAADVALLFVQTAGATTIEPNDDGETLALTLHTTSSQTLYFSDRPARITGAVPTERFLAVFDGEARTDPPNAVLIGHPTTGAEDDEALVIELLSATYDAGTGQLTYQVRLLGADEDAGYQLESEPLTALDEGRTYAEAHLFIDDVSACYLIPDPVLRLNCLASA